LVTSIWDMFNNWYSARL